MQRWNEYWRSLCQSDIWSSSFSLRRAVVRTVVPVFLIFAANDYSIAPEEALAAEMERLGKPLRIQIYPAVGHTTPEGHGFVHLRVATWQPDVFACLDKHMRKVIGRDKRLNDRRAFLVLRELCRVAP